MEKSSDHSGFRSTTERRIGHLIGERDMAQQRASDVNGPSTSIGMEFPKLQLPDAPSTETGAVKAWEEPVVMRSYMPAAPDPNPMFLEKRVYQGSSGRVYPLPVIDRIDTEPKAHAWKAAHIENELDRKSTRLNSSHCVTSRMPSSA